jgi:hypothetical protein
MMNRLNALRFQPPIEWLKAATLLLFPRQKISPKNLLFLGNKMVNFAPHLSINLYYAGLLITNSKPIISVINGDY